MKKILTLAITLLLTLGISAQSDNKTKCITLTKKEFIEKVFDFTAQNKEWQYKGDKPAIIDFYADWCGPCRKLAPVLEEIAAEQEGKLYIYKVNVDKEPEVATAFGIRSLPTLIFIPMEGAPSGFSGYAEKSELYKAINAIMPQEESKE